MTRTFSTRPRRAAAFTAVALTLPLGLLGASLLETTSAGYRDTASAQTSSIEATSLRTQGAVFEPVNTYIANTAVALQDDGTVWVWGYRGGGLSGTGVATVANNATPSAVVLPNDGYTGVGGQRRAIKVAGTSNDNYYPTDATYTGLAALSDDGVVYTWGGNNATNMMGRPGSGAAFYSPGAVTIPVSDGPVVDLVSSSGVFMALTSNGTLYTWGYAQGRGITGQGSLAASSTTPKAIMTGVHSIGAGVWNGWAVKGNYATGDTSTGVFWWGWANNGDNYAGDPSGDTKNATVSVPTRSTTLSLLASDGCETVGVVAGSESDTCRIQSLTGHYYGSQLVTREGQLVTWGCGNQFGTGRPNGTTAANNAPTLLTLPGGTATRKVAVTEDYVLVLGTDGVVYAYGRYAFARGPEPTTGAMSTTNLVIPAAITALGKDVRDIGGFGYSGMALRSDGNLALWGGSTQGGVNNTYMSVRNAWGSPTTPTNASQPITTFVLPGVG